MMNSKIFCVFALVLMIVSVIPISGYTLAEQEPAEDLNDRNMSPLWLPQWKAGDYWNYTFQSEGSNEQLTKINQDGWFNLSVRGEEHIRIDGEWINVYNVSFKSEGDMTGHTRRFFNDWDYEFYGITTGSLYYHTKTLELAAGDFSHHIFGEAQGPGNPLGVDTIIIIDFHNTEVTGQSDYGDFYSFPISDSDNWEALSVLDMYSYTYTKYDVPPLLKPIVPDETLIIEEYILEHSYSLQASALHGGDDEFSITGDLQWSRDGDMYEDGDHSKIDDGGSGSLEYRFDRNTGNSDFIFMENTFHKTLTYTVDEIEYQLVSYEYTPPVEYEFDVDIDNPSKNSRVGETVGYEFELTSSGAKIDTILWEVLDDHGLDSVDGPASITLPWGESETVLLTLTFSADAEPGTTYEHEIRFYSENDDSVHETVTVSTHLLDERGFEVSIIQEQKQTNPGYSVGYEFEITNTGTDQDNIHWGVLDEENLDEVDGPESIILESEESTTVWIHLTFASDTETDTIYDHVIEFYLESDDSIRKTVTVKTELLDRYGLEAYTLDGHRQIRRGMSANYRFTVKATGTHGDVINWELLDHEDVDDVHGPASINLESKESKTLWINLTYSEHAIQGEVYTKEIRFSSVNDGSINETVTISTEILEESLPIITGKHPDKDVLELWPEDDDIQFSLEVDNPGDHAITTNWYVDDVKTLEDETYTISYTDLDIGQYRIKGEITYNGGSAAVYWDVHVMEEEDDDDDDDDDGEVNITAFIESKIPDVDEMTIYPGHTVDFSVIVANPNDDDVFVKWTINGDEIYQGTVVSLGDNDITEHSSTLVASLMFDDKVIEYVNWTLNKIDDSSPYLIEKRPRINNIPGHSSNSDITFSVNVDNPEGAAILLRWYVNGDLRLEGNRNFTIPAKDLSQGNYTVRVELLDENHDVLDSNTWTVEVRDPESSNFLLYIIIAVIAVIALISALLVLRRRKKRSKKDELPEDEPDEEEIDIEEIEDAF